MTVRALSLAFIAVWLVLGLYFMLQGMVLKLGTISSPGTGFMPFFIGLVLIVFGILSAIPLLISLRLIESGAAAAPAPARSGDRRRVDDRVCARAGASRLHRQHAAC